MPARQPFTALCQAAARPSSTDRADLHIHTVHSDGLYTPEQVVDLAKRAGLVAVAITDHDTLAGVGEALEAASGSRLEVIAGVEISSRYREREIHLLGYFVDPTNHDLTNALASLQRERASRFETMLARLREEGVQLPEMPPSDSIGRSLGRRSLAELLVQAGKVGSIREAFHRYLGDGRAIAAPKVLVGAAQGASTYPPGGRRCELGSPFL